MSTPVLKLSMLCTEAGTRISGKYVKFQGLVPITSGVLERGATLVIGPIYNENRFHVGQQYELTLEPKT